MSYCQDLTPCDSFHQGGLTGVGWLEPGHFYQQGAVDELFLSALRRLLAFPWFPYAFGGPHECGFCHSVYGNDNLLVPAVNVLFVCPGMILHYIEEHGYRPPQIFQEAVLACPPTDSQAYFDLLAPSAFMAECHKFCPDLRAYHTEASQRYRERRLSG